MQNAARAYSQAAKTSTPRNLEASLLIKSAARLQNFKDNWADDNRQGLYDVLAYNRKLWSVFVGSVARPENPLPKTIKDNIASLGVFIFQHTLDIQRQPAAAKLNTLISINQEIAAGLRGNGAG